MTRADEAIDIPPGEIAERGSTRAGNAGPSTSRVRVALVAVVGGATASNHRDRAVGRCAARRTLGPLAVELRDTTVLAGRTLVCLSWVHDNRSDGMLAGSVLQFSELCGCGFVGADDGGGGVVSRTKVCKGDSWGSGRRSGDPG